MNRVDGDLLALLKQRRPFRSVLACVIIGNRKQVDAPDQQKCLGAGVELAQIRQVHPLVFGNPDQACADVQGAVFRTESLIGNHKPPQLASIHDDGSGILCEEEHGQ